MKYNNKKIKTEDGLIFDSKREYNYWLKLKEEDVNFCRQVKFELQKGYVNGNGEKIRPITYVADFVIYDENNRILRVIDVKGMKTEVYKIKKKLFDCKYKPLTIEEV